MYRFRDTLPIDISEQTISGDLVTIANPEEMGVVDSLEVSLEPIQDLNGYDKPWAEGAGKNLLHNEGENVTHNGITYTVNADGSVTANGTSTGNAQIFLKRGFNLKAGTYTISGCPSSLPNTGNNYIRLYSSSAGFAVSDYPTTKGDATKALTQDITDGIMWINIAPNTTVNNVTFYPQLELGSTATDFAPYSNICPISGHTECVTEVCGVNVWDEEWEVGGYSSSTGLPIESSVIRSKNAIPVIPNIGYYFRSAFAQTDVFRIYWYDGADNFISVNNSSTDTNKVINSPANAHYMRFNCSGAYGTTYHNDISINYPSTDHDYHAYNGNTYTTTLGRTVYGGTLDVVSGVLTVDRAMVELNADMAWSKSSSYNGSFYSQDVTNTFGFKKNTPFTCSHATAVSSLSNYAYGKCYCDSAANLWLMEAGATVNDWKNYLTTQANGGTPVSIVGQLATPQTYQLTPQQISLLLGENHLWSDGEISVVWHKDLTKGRILPTEAVSINGQYIENVLDGYRTLYTKGRESLGAELNTYSVGTADGEKFKNKRYPARELTVGFQLIADNAEDFREKFNNLNNLLSLDEADFIFHDEEDKFFSGYPIMNAEVEAGENSVKGEWKIYCAYPFKRSVDPITLTMADATVTNTTATWAIDYKGAQPARPILRAKFAGAKSGGSSGEDGDCGFVAFMDARENIIQLGNPEVLDLDEYTKAGTLVNKEFVNTSGWTVNGGHSYGGAISGSISTSNTVDAYWNGGKGQTQSYAKPTYGDTGGRVTMHGPTLWKNTAGAVNFTLSAVHRLCVEKSNEYGKFELGAYNHETGTLVAGFTITKTSNGTTGTVRYIANGEVVGTDKIDLSYNNTHFGYCKRSEVYTTQTYKEKAWVKVQVPIGRNKYQTKSQLQWVNKTRQVFSGYTYTQSNLNSSIQKAGAYVYFQVGNLPKRTFNVPDIEQMVAHDASCHLCAYKTAMHTNMVHSIVFRRQAVTAFAEQPNVFTAGDIVEADCNEATVNIYHAGSMGGHLEPQYGALGNDWENFILTSGVNVIQATWSDWVNPTYKPQIEIEYNEVFI